MTDEELSALRQKGQETLDFYTKRALGDSDAALAARTILTLLDEISCVRMKTFEECAVEMERIAEHRLALKLRALKRTETSAAAPVPYGHCNRCARCGWAIVPPDQHGCWATNCSMRPMPELRTTCAGCGAPYEKMPSTECDHGVSFDGVAAEGMSSTEVRRLWPRLNGVCPKGCGFEGIHYASKEHQIWGDW